MNAGHFGFLELEVRCWMLDVGCFISICLQRQADGHGGRLRRRRLDLDGSLVGRDNPARNAQTEAAPSTSLLCAGSPRKNRSNMRGNDSGGMPGPVLAMENSAAPFARRKFIVTLPCG